jgi:hypothetical protein
MIVFLDFEASSLGKRSYPIEVAWVFEDGRSEAHLIHPAPSWTDWDEAAEAIHHIPRSTLLNEGEPHDAVARRMAEELAGHDPLASAPSWDGKWLSVLLRSAGLERRTLRLRDTDDAIDEAARMILSPSVPPELLDATVEDLVTLIEVRTRGKAPVHRALADAEAERQRWLAVRGAAIQLEEQYRRGG